VEFKRDDIILITESFGVGVAHIGKFARVINTMGITAHKKEYRILVKLLDDKYGGMFVNGIHLTPLLAALC
jgi:hypothetical protein